jgi:large subunit ribosomal protein L10
MAQKKISEAKAKKVKEIIRFINDSDTFMVVSSMSLPSGQFQEIRKKIRGSAEMMVVRKKIMLKVLESLGGEIAKIGDHINENTALIFSKLNPFEISAMLSENKSPAKAKAGQTAEEDISIEPGPTDLVPGPAISELQSLGLKIQIEDGKITIREGKVIAKAGQPITAPAAGLMSKLNILPFKIGFEPIAAYSGVDKKIYVGINVDKAKSLSEFKNSYSGAIALAVSLAYPAKEALPFILAKAAAHEKAISKLIKTDSQ